MAAKRGGVLARPCYQLGCKGRSLDLLTLPPQQTQPSCRRLQCHPPSCSAGEAIDAGVQVAVCSTSSERAVSNIVRVMLGDRVAGVMRVSTERCIHCLSARCAGRACRVMRVAMFLMPKWGARAASQMPLNATD